MEVIVKTYRTPNEANLDAAVMAEEGWYPQGTAGGGTGFSPVKGAAKGALAGGALFVLSGGVIPPIAGFLGRKKWRTPEPITITWVRDSHSVLPSGTSRATSDEAATAQVEYDLHNWSAEDIDHALAQVRYLRIPHRWDDGSQVLTVPGKYEEAMNKLVLGDG